MVIKRNHNYRAIDTETKEWVYGSLVGDDYLVTDKLLDNIESDGYIECWLNVLDPNSVCESVHIKDRHKTEMFECDVVAFLLMERYMIKITLSYCGIIENVLK